MKNPPAVRCSYQVRTDGMGFHWHQCFSAGKVMRGGKMFCGTHDPVRRKEKEAARSAKWNEDWEATKARAAEQAVARARAALCVAACDWMTDTEVSLLAAIPKTCVLSLIYRKS